MSWIDPLIFGIRNLYANGVLQTFFPGINFGAGLTVTPTANGYATVTATSTGVIPATELTTGLTLTSPTVNATYTINSTSAPIAITIAGTPSPGVQITVIDRTQNWATYPFSFIGQSGSVVGNPGNVGATRTGSVSLSLSGGSATWQYVTAGGISAWLPV